MRGHGSLSWLQPESKIREFRGGREYLFLKNISDHSTGALKELCEGISIAFAAIGNSSIPHRKRAKDSMCYYISILTRLSADLVYGMYVTLPISQLRRRNSQFARRKVIASSRGRQMERSGGFALGNQTAGRRGSQSAEGNSPGGPQRQLNAGTVFLGRVKEP